MKYVGLMFGNNITLVTFLIIAVLTVCFLLFRKFIWKPKKRESKNIFTETSILDEEKLESVAEEPRFVTIPLVKAGGNGKKSVESARTLVNQVEIDPKGKFRAIVWGISNIYFANIKKQSGNLVYLDPSMPESGPHYSVREIIDADTGEITLLPYDPRERKVDSKLSPGRCYTATHVYDLVNAVFANKYGMWDKVNMVFAGIAMGMFFIVMLVAIDKL